MYTLQVNTTWLIPSDFFGTVVRSLFASFPLPPGKARTRAWTCVMIWERKRKKTVVVAFGGFRGFKHVCMRVYLFFTPKKLGYFDAHMTLTFHSSVSVWMYVWMNEIINGSWCKEIDNLKESMRELFSFFVFFSLFSNYFFFFFLLHDDAHMWEVIIISIHRK